MRRHVESPGREEAMKREGKLIKIAQQEKYPIVPAPRPGTARRTPSLTIPLQRVKTRFCVLTPIFLTHRLSDQPPMLRGAMVTTPPGRDDLRVMRTTGVPVQTIGPDVTTTAFRRDGQDYMVLESGERRKLPNVPGVIVVEEDP